MSLALPAWAKRLLDVALPRWRTLPADGYLFASPRDRTTVRTDLDRTLRDLVDRAVVPGVVTMQSVRRAGLSAHRALHAPRAVVRGTATARLDGAHRAGPPRGSGSAGVDLPGVTFPPIDRPLGGHAASVIEAR